jgi:hypothetical protein
MPNNKLKPIFRDKFYKFSKTVAKCEDPSECDPIQVVVFLNQWTSRRNYSIAGIRTLVHWISEVHKEVDGNPLYHHEKMREFINNMENKIARGDTGSGPPPDKTPAVKSFYSPVITTSSDLSKATRCRFCNEKFKHSTKLLYHMLHLHKESVKNKMVMDHPV